MTTYKEVNNLAIKYTENKVVKIPTPKVTEKPFTGPDPIKNKMKAAIILFFMGSGPVKGFAVTLGVGIFTTLFSVYFIARLLTSIYVSKNKNKEVSI